MLIPNVMWPYVDSTFICHALRMNGHSSRWRRKSHLTRCNVGSTGWTGIASDGVFPRTYLPFILRDNTTTATEGPQAVGSNVTVQMI